MPDCFLWRAASEPIIPYIFSTSLELKDFCNRHPDKVYYHTTLWKAGYEDDVVLKWSKVSQLREYMNDFTSKISVYYQYTHHMCVGNNTAERRRGGILFSVSFCG